MGSLRHWSYRRPPPSRNEHVDQGETMSFRENERAKAIAMRDAMFRDPGGGFIRGKDRDFALKDSKLNLWAGIREDAIDYFTRNAIPWWMGSEGSEPTGHLLSSQVACVNHLYSLRQRRDAATAVLKAVSENIVEAVTVEDGSVAFEVVGADNYLNEKSHTRGANATSVDAVMVGRKRSGSNLLVLIEWKYTEDYAEECKYIPARSDLYDRLLAEDDCPIVAEDYEALYFEPFYQLMRQTLLGWKMVQHEEYGCDDYIHLHVIPAGNRELRDRITSPGLRSKGDTMSAAWKSVLRDPGRYVVITPEDLMKPALDCPDTAAIADYLKKRYWE